MANSFSNDVVLERYMAQVNRHPLLTREQETTLADRYRDSHDAEAAHTLVVSNLRFVVKICHEYRGYGVNLADLIQEGSIGLMHAVSKFDPSKGFRLISYAVWWIRAFIQNFVMRSWSMVKIGTTQAQRKMFFKLRSARELADREGGNKGRAAGLTLLAGQFGVTEDDVTAMESRLAGRDFSLDAPVDSGPNHSHVDALSTTGPRQDEQLATAQDHDSVRRSVSRAMTTMSERERYIVVKRLTAVDSPHTYGKSVYAFMSHASACGKSRPVFWTKSAKFWSKRCSLVAT